MKEVGVAGDKESIKTMISKLDGKNLPDVIAEGYEKFAAVGGGGAAAAGPAAGADAGAPAEAKEEKKKEEEPEEDVDMGDLFGGGDDDY